MLKKVKRILLIVLIFICFSLIATYAWYIIERAVFNNTNASNLGFGNFLLYLFGYGDIDEVNLTFKLIYSIIGIMALALLSSVFTVSLFEWKNKLIISEKMLVWDDRASEHFASIFIENKYRDIYKLTLTMHLSTGNNSVFEERFIPYVSKNSMQLINYKIETGSILYKYLRDVIKFGYNSTLTLIASYIDSGNGQEYYLCNKYQFTKDKNNQIIINNNEKVHNLDVEKKNIKEFNSLLQAENQQYADYISEEIKSDGFSIEISKAQAIRDENIDVYYGKAPTTNKKAFDTSIINPNTVITSEIHFKKKKEDDPNDFGMLLIKRPFDGDWQKYYDLNCVLTFDIYVSVGMVVSLEMKDSRGALIINPMPKFYPKSGFENYTYELNTMQREKWSDVDEMCFTVLRKDTKADNGEFSLIGCELVSN